ncbi:MAG: zinc ribbon domain-containing protein [Oscillospiraceae bacterium]|nr:zinc ribbon domain-containing protein [Oscillospiraceae bacterium]
MMKSHVGTGAMSTKKVRLLFVICTFSLCLAFFIVPLVSMSGNASGGMFSNFIGGDSSLGGQLSFGFSVTGFQFAVGQPEMHMQFLGIGIPVEAFEQPLPFMFILLIMPITLLALSFLPRPFIPLLIFSIIGAIIKISFMVIVSTVLLPFGTLRIIGISIGMTAFSWIIAIIYVGLIFIAVYGMRLEKTNNNIHPSGLAATMAFGHGSSTFNCSCCNNPIRIGASFCKNCGQNVVSETTTSLTNISRGHPFPSQLACPQCGNPKSKMNVSFCKNCGQKLI